MAKVLIAAYPEMKKKYTLKSLRAQLPEAFWVSSNGYEENIFRSTLGHLMCKQLLLEEVKEEVLGSLHTSRYGKWKLQNSTLDFNIAHSKDYVVVVLTNQGVAGIDVEHVRPISWRDYENCFSFTEWKKINSSTQPEEEFFALWTRKESLTKAYGLGLQFPLNEILVSEHRGVLHNTTMEGYFYPVPIPGYSACVCLSEQQHLMIEHFG